MSRSAVLAILLSCVTALLAPAVAGAECETHLIYHYDSFGNLISVEPTCFGTCDATSSCEVVGAGTLLWCQCVPGGGTEICVGVVVGSDLRCLNLECPGACEKQSVGWTTPKTGETHLQEWCECQ